MADRLAGPPLGVKASVALSSLGWLVGAMTTAGTVAWCRALRRALTR